jgi:predicted phage terminase large subunit-like protein
LNPQEDALLEKIIIKNECEQDHLFFSRYFFKHRQNIKFIVNWHHKLICEVIDDVIAGRKKNVIITVSPGSSKTELVVINFIARGLALNPYARFLHLSGSDSLASLNSATAREIVKSDEYQALWPLQIADDANAKKRWNVMVDGKIAGGVYATALGGQVTGFRAGHMVEGFSGCIILDDPIKADDAFSRPKLDAANRKLITTVKSRKARPDTPIILVMQRIAQSDPVQFILDGHLDGDWDLVRIPAILDDPYIETLPEKYGALVKDQREYLRLNSPDEIQNERFSYWPYKEPLQTLLKMERGEGTGQTGQRISRYVYASQYNQTPVAQGGNIIRGEHFKRYRVLPKIKYRKIYADTAQKTKEANDYSVFEEWGIGEDGPIYLLDMIRGKWEAPELQKRAIAFWSKAKARDGLHFGQLREMMVEDKSSGTGLIQTLKLHPYNIPIKGVERDKDKLTRVMDALPYIEAGQIYIPEQSPFVLDFISECEAFTADDTHDHDDQVDPLCDAVIDLLSTNKLKVWEQVG